MTVDIEDRRLRFYSGARVGLLPKAPRRAAGLPPSPTVLPAAVGPDSPGPDVPGGRRIQQAAGVEEAPAATPLSGSRAWNEWDD